MEKLLHGRLVKRLRGHASEDDHARGCDGRTYSCACGYDDRSDALHLEAADALESLQSQLTETLAEVGRLREALEPFKRAIDDWGDDTGQPDRWNVWEHPIAQNVTIGDFRAARAALSQGEG